MHPSDDFRTSLLTSIFSTSSRELAKMLRDLSRLEELTFTYQRVIRLLSDLRSAASGWAGSFLPQFYREEDLKQVQANGLRISELNSNPVEEIIKRMIGDIDKALSSIQSLVKKIQRKRAEAPIGETLVSIIGKDGRTYRFELAYYVSLVAQSAVQNARISASLERSHEINNDLIQVSSLLSNYENACDYYAGNVFSISGKSKIYPALSSIPPAPFHPWCQYTLDLYLKDEVHQNTVPKWAFLKSPKDTFSRIVGRLKEMTNA